MSTKPDSVAMLRKLADHLDSVEPEAFNQAEWCGTACCIAGHAVKVFPELLQVDGFIVKRGQHSGAYAFADAIGLDFGDADFLTSGGAYHVTPPAAAAACRAIADRLERERQEAK